MESATKLKFVTVCVCVCRLVAGDEEGGEGLAVSQPPQAVIQVSARLAALC